MKTSTWIFAPVFAVALLVGLTHWTGSSRADTEAPVSGGMSAPFEYYPAQFPSQASEAGEHIPTF